MIAEKVQVVARLTDLAVDLPIEIHVAFTVIQILDNPFGVLGDYFASGIVLTQDKAFIAELALTLRTIRCAVIDQM